MRNTTYHCDLCGEEEEQNQISHATVMIKSHPHLTEGKDVFHPMVGKDVCKKCMEGFGFVFDKGIKDQVTIGSNFKAIFTKLLGKKAVPKRRPMIKHDGFKFYEGT